MKVAVEGCCHGELDKIYETLQYLEKINNIKVDLLLICGDFQAVRNKDDLDSMAVPKKYQKLNTFYKYYSGEIVAPVLTVFIGGNHEASNYMQELPYGGWVAKNIYYLGYAGVIQVGGLRIGGLSGIFKGHDYYKGHYEHPPYTEDSKRSVYHIRNLEVFRLKQLTRHLDIFMSHDWPKDIARYGDVNALLNRKSFLKPEIENGSLGSPPSATLLHTLQPAYWFSAHLHVKFAANVQHSTGKCTKFLSLDKCLPRRQFLQVLDFPDKEEGPVRIQLDPEWLCVLQATNHLLHLGDSRFYMPESTGSQRYSFEVSDKDMEKITGVFGGDLTLPENFETTAPTLKERELKPPGPPLMINPQTTLLCNMLDLTDPNAVHLGLSDHSTDVMYPSNDPDELYAGNDSDVSEDGLPSDINSSLDTSFANSSVDAANLSSGSVRQTLASRLSAIGSCTPDLNTSGAPTGQVEDDDEEFMAILAVQRKNSQSCTPQSVSRQGTEKKASGSDSEAMLSLPSSPKVERSVDDCTSIRETEKDDKDDSDLAVRIRCEGDCASWQEKSSSDIDCSSQDSEGRADTSLPQDGSRNSAMDCADVETSLSAGNDSPGTKRPSPDARASASTVKKLKRRNESMYSTSGTEENAC